MGRTQPVRVAPVTWRAASTSGGDGGGGDGRPAGSSTTVAAPNVISTSGIIPLNFVFTNLAASATTQGTWNDVGTVSLPMPFRGSIVAIGFSANATKTAGTAYFTAYVDSSATTAALYWDTNTATDYIVFSEGSIPFEAGELLDIRATTDASFTPAASTEVGVSLYVTFQP